MLKGSMEGEFSSLEAKRLSLAHKRRVLEKRYNSRVAAQADYSVFKLQAMKRSAKNLRRQQEFALKRKENLELMVNKCKFGLEKSKEVSANSENLMKQRLQFLDRVNELYATWQNTVEREHIRRVKDMQVQEAIIRERLNRSEQAFENSRTMQEAYLIQKEKLDIVREKERIQLSSIRTEEQNMKQKLKSTIYNEKANLEEHRESEPGGMHVKQEVRLAKEHELSPQEENDIAKGTSADGNQSTNEDVAVKTNIPKTTIDLSLTSSPNTSLSDETNTVDAHDSSVEKDEIIDTWTSSNQNRSSERTHFRLSYEWDKVPSGFRLDDRAEQKLDVNTMGRLAKIPDSWDLSFRLRSMGRELTGMDKVFSIPIDKTMDFQSVSTEIVKAVDLKDVSISIMHIICPDGAQWSSGMVESLGDSLFSETVEVFIELENATNNDVVSKQEFTMDWEVIGAAINRFREVLEDKGNYEAVRGIKYGLVGAGTNSDEVSRILDNTLYNNDFKENMDMEVYVEGIKQLITMYGIGLVPLSLLLKHSDKNGYDSIGKDLLEYHVSCGDGRQQVWDSLCLHWNWLIRENILSREKVCDVFLETLLPPGEDSMGPVAKQVWALIQYVTTQRLSMHTEMISSPNQPSELGSSTSNPQSKKPFRDYGEESMDGTIEGSESEENSPKDTRRDPRKKGGLFTFRKPSEIYEEEYAYGSVSATDYASTNLQDSNEDDDEFDF